MRQCVGDRPLGGLQVAVDVVVGVCVGDMTALEVERQLEEAVLEQVAPVADERVDVVRQQVPVAPRPRTVHEVGDEDRPVAGYHRGDAEPGADLGQPLAHPIAEPEDVFVHRLRAQLLDRGQRRRHHQRVPVVRPGEEGRSARTRGEHVHQVGAPAQGPDGNPVPDGLAQRGQVGDDTADLLIAAEPVPESGDDLVEDQNRLVPGAQFPDGCQEFRVGKHGADVVRDRLQDDGGDLVAPVVEELSQRGAVVELQHQRRLQYLVQDAGGDRVAVADPVGCGDDIQADGVVPAVIAALELDDVAPTCCGAGHSQRVEGGLGPRRGQQDLLDGRHQLDQLLGELHLTRRDTHADQVRLVGGGRDGRGDVRVVVTEQRRPERGVKVRVHQAIRVRERSALGRGDHELLESGDEALAAVDAARNRLLGAGGERGAGGGPVEGTGAMLKVPIGSAGQNVIRECKTTRQSGQEGAEAERGTRWIRCCRSAFGYVQSCPSRTHRDRRTRRRPSTRRPGRRAGARRRASTDRSEWMVR